MDGTRQLRWLSVYAALTYPFACVPFLYLHFRAHGVTVEQYHRMIAVYYATMVVAEVPTGMLADRFGRRPALVLGPFVLALGYALIAQGRSFLPFCVAQAVIGIGHSIISGPPSALLFETLQALDRRQDYLRLESRMHGIRLLGTAAAFLIGGFVVLGRDIVAAIWTTIGLHVVGGVAALWLAEADRAGQKARTFGSLVATARRDLGKGDVLWIASYFVLVFFLLRYCFHTYLIFLEQVEETRPLVLGALYAALNLAAVPFARLSATAVERLGAPRVYLGMLWLLAFSLIAMGSVVSWAMLPLLLLHQIPLGMHWGIVQSFVNERLAPGSRATMLSALSLLARLVFALLFPLIGIINEQHGLPAAYLTVGVAGGVLAVVCVLRGRRYL
jgi:MFS family permease